MCKKVGLFFIFKCCFPRWVRKFLHYIYERDCCGRNYSHPTWCLKLIWWLPGRKGPETGQELVASSSRATLNGTGEEGVETIVQMLNQGRDWLYRGIEKGRNNQRRENLSPAPSFFSPGFPVAPPLDRKEYRACAGGGEKAEPEERGNAPDSFFDRLARGGRGRSSRALRVSARGRLRHRLAARTTRVRSRKSAPVQRRHGEVPPSAPAVFGLGTRRLTDPYVSREFGVVKK